MGRHPILVIEHFFWQAVDWLYPPFCASCGREGERWCGECQQQVQRIDSNVCLKCGIPLKKATLCSECRRASPPYAALRSWGVFKGPLREAIHHLKYKNDLGLSEVLAGCLLQLYRNLNWDSELVIPVPLSSSRLRERGYNQSNLLSKPLALSSGLAFAPRALSRIRHTNSQVGLGRPDRVKNVHGAFRAKTQSVQNRRILLVDDVATTGATLVECTQTLLDAGAAEVRCLTLARAGPNIAPDAV